MNKCFVYHHRRLDSNDIFYIGIGRSYEYKRYARAYSKTSRSVLWHRIVNKYGYKWEIVAENLSVEQAKEMEIMLIAKYGRIDMKTGFLCNMTHGGDGINDYKHTESTKEQLRQLTIQQNARGKNARLGTTHTEETKIMMRNNRAGKPKSKSFCENLRQLKSIGLYKIYRNGVELGQFVSSTQASEAVGIPARSISMLAVTGGIGKMRKSKGYSVMFTENKKTVLGNNL